MSLNTRLAGGQKLASEVESLQSTHTGELRAIQRLTHHKVGTIARIRPWAQSKLGNRSTQQKQNAPTDGQQPGIHGIRNGVRRL
jgi:hypothetical protein